jgi:uncharacterized membrane protein
MKASDFISQLDEARIVEAIRVAESHTTGEIRVFVSRKKTSDAVKAALKHFELLGMARTKQRNAVLIFIAPQTRKFAIVGDQAIHERGGDVLWWKAVSQMEYDLKTADATTAILRAVKEVASALAEHFPNDGSKPNELSDTIAKD